MIEKKAKTGMQIYLKVKDENGWFVPQEEDKRYVELEEAQKLEAKIETYKNWLFSYKDDTRLSMLSVKIRFSKIFGIAYQYPKETVANEEMKK